ncbi:MULTISPECIES: hypothetical protein [Bradyrhizobium]|jgi:hypothetical protein|uniref:hypothetical protein n=1 Tax=Bradyrhizobium TaxID=374 RepID=UPI002012F4E7|nr:MULTISPECIES: hypothetical protein [Bradyrhizobium]
MNADRHYAVASILFDYVKSPSLKHLREPHSVHKVSREIVKALDGASSVWKKWGESARRGRTGSGSIWIPVEDLQAFLNTLPGLPLTKTDVEQSLRAIWEEPHTSYPKDELRNGCVALCQSDKGNGTEMRAIIGALQERIEREEDRLRNGAGAKLSALERGRANKAGTAVSVGRGLCVDQNREIRSILLSPQRSCVPHRAGQRQALDPVSG